MASNSNIHEISARKFIDHCKDKFGWNDLTNEVIMDVGCGVDGWYGRAILEKFPDVRAIIGINSDQKVVSNFKLKTTPKIHCFLADMEKRETLQNYEGKMNKVISTHAFHQILKKEEAFQNVFHMLKPGGEAAILFTMRSFTYEWLTEMLRNPKWKEAYQKEYIVDMYRRGVKADYFKEMVEKIGFRVLEASEKEIVIPYTSDQACKESMYKMSEYAFKIPPETAEQFKEESFKVLLDISGRNDEGKPCYRSIELCLLLAKPSESSESSGAKNPGS